ncbi:unnamed protein product [Malus baccata var. baccata]
MAVEQLKIGREQGVFSRVDDEILQNILGRLPGVEFSSAVGVNANWNKNFGQMLSRPKFSSALSLKPDLHMKFLTRFSLKPIWLDFIVAYIGTNFSLEETHQLITEKIGCGVPIITNRTMGLIGTDVEAHNLNEVNWAQGNSARNTEMIHRGIVVSVGYVPYLRVEVFPQPSPRHSVCYSAPHLLMMEHFVRDIQCLLLSAALAYDGAFCEGYSELFHLHDKNVDMNLVVAALDTIMPEKTAIVGDASASLMCTRRNETGNYSRDLFNFATAALVFVKDQHIPDFLLLTNNQFYELTWGRLSSMSHCRRVSFHSVLISRQYHLLSSWISAVMSGFKGVFIDSHIILRELQSQVWARQTFTLGSRKQRQYYNGASPPVSMTTLNFHEVRGGYGDFILVDGVGIQPDDVLFFFYHSDAITALNTIDYAFDNLQTFVHNDSEIQPEMFGGFIFSSKKRDASMFNRPNVDCKPFADNFPVVPVAGMFGNKEIACSGLLGEEEDQELGHPRYVHACSSMYLAMTYVPPQAPYYLKE